MKKILFVCTGNVCRSPMAELMFRELVRGREDYAVASAGVGAIPGQPASQHTAEILHEKGIPSDHFRSQPLTFELMNQATHVFAMADQHLRLIELDFPEQSSKAYLVTEFVKEDALRGKDVSDPIGMGRAAYEQTHDMLEKSLPSALAFIDQTWKES